MAEFKIEVDMSELDAAKQKARALLSMLDDIERRFDDIERRFAALPGKADACIRPVPSSPSTPAPPKSKR